MMTANIIVIAVALLSLLCSQSYAVHNEPTTSLRGYHCKDDSQSDVHHPCELCPEGHYCTDKFTMNKCGSADVYCPLGSVHPTPVSEGYYSVNVDSSPDDQSMRVSQKICEAGNFCVGGIMNVCPKGHYCNASGMAKPLKCGHSGVFCAEGSIEPQQVLKGYYTVGGTSNEREEQVIAPKGYYATEGILKECPAGHFGNTTGLFNDDCSGSCHQGWFCPSASISPKQIACGGENYICPEGSAFPQRVKSGYYTTIFDEEPCRPGKFRVPLPEIDDVGPSSVSTTVAKDSCISCPEGMHKPISGDNYSLCLDCGPNAFSSKDGTACECYQSATDKKIESQSFYDWTSGTCYDITHDVTKKDFPEDYHQPGDQVTKFIEKKCEAEAGYYCQGGIRYKCPAGRYGNKEMEVNSACSGPCEEGYYCPEASISPTQNKCGSADVFCPRQSATPTYVSKGYYSNENDSVDKKTSQHLCPPGFYCPGDGSRRACPSGRYGASSGLSDEGCDGECTSGFFCIPGSTSPVQSPCGNATVYCPKASAIPILVDDGYYSASETYSITANYAGPNATHDIQKECEVGYWCQEGLKYWCPEGTYGDMSGSTSLDQCKPCEPGFFCQSQPAPPTTKDTQAECGDASKFCPESSAAPRIVDLGYYTLNRLGTEEGLETQRTSQVLCPPGYFCKDGLRFECAEGKYGDTSGLHDEMCSGYCPRGYFCPEKSIHPIPCSPGSYSSGGAKECTSCEVPLTVPVEVINSMCRNDRSCCFDYE